MLPCTLNYNCDLNLRVIPSLIALALKKPPIFYNLSLHSKMDPVSFITSTLAIVGPTIKAVQMLNDYVSKYKAADLSIASLRVECSCIRVALLQIQKVFTSDTGHNVDDVFEDYLLIDFQQTLGVCSQLFSILRERLAQTGLEDLNDSNEPNLTSKIRYMLKASEVVDLTNNIRGLSGSLNILLTAFSWYSILCSTLATPANISTVRHREKLIML